MFIIVHYQRQGKLAILINFLMKNSYISPKYTQSLSYILQPFLSGIDFQIIHLKSPNLLLSCKSITDLLSCSSISAIGEDCSYYDRLSTADYLSLQCASDSD